MGQQPPPLLFFFQRLRVGPQCALTAPGTRLIVEPIPWPQLVVHLHSKVASLIFWVRGSTKHNTKLSERGQAAKLTTGNCGREHAERRGAGVETASCEAVREHNDRERPDAESAGHESCAAWNGLRRWAERLATKRREARRPRNDQTLKALGERPSCKAHDGTKAKITRARGRRD